MLTQTADSLSVCQRGRMDYITKIKRTLKSLLEFLLLKYIWPFCYLETHLVLVQKVPFPLRNGVFLRLCSLFCVNSLHMNITYISLIRKKMLFQKKQEISSLLFISIESTNVHSTLFMRCRAFVGHCFSMGIQLLLFLPFYRKLVT